jgi:hypothetical protein
MFFNQELEGELGHKTLYLKLKFRIYRINIYAKYTQEV